MCGNVLSHFLNNANPMAKQSTNLGYEEKFMRLTGSLSIALVAMLTAGSAAAHHPLNGMPMETFSQGVLSGVGHPLLGFDHLFFVIAAGIAAVFTTIRVMSLGGYLVAMAAGCLLMYAGITLPLTELIVAISLVAVGGLLATGTKMRGPIAVGLFALFGLFHGSAFGGSIATAEAAVSLAVLGGYLLGLIAVQFAIGWIAGSVAKTFSKMALETPSIGARLAGAAVAGVGMFLVLEIAEGPLVQALI